jgi:hypothetical protein
MDFPANGAGSRRSSFIRSNDRVAQWDDLIRARLARICRALADFAVTDQCCNVQRCHERMNGDVAQVRLEQTAQHIRGLMAHPDFRLRSGFAGGRSVPRGRPPLHAGATRISKSQGNVGRA